MIRFFVNLILFGLLFYAIYRFFPDAFETLVSWVGHIYDFVADIVMWVVDKIQAAVNAGKAS